MNDMGICLPADFPAESKNRKKRELKPESAPDPVHNKTTKDENVSISVSAKLKFVVNEIEFNDFTLHGLIKAKDLGSDKSKLCNDIYLFFAYVDKVFLYSENKAYIYN